MGRGETLKHCTPSHLCAYHEARVEISEIPPPEVYSLEHLETIHQMISTKKSADVSYSRLSSTEKLRVVLNLVNTYWLDNASSLDGILRDYHEKWEKEARNRDKYPSHGWMSSPQQFSQLVESVNVLRENKVQLNGWLVLGTASGANTAQLAETVRQAGVDPKFYILDRCHPPIKDSLTTDRFGISADALRLPFSNESFNVISSHFTSSFIPTEQQRVSEGLSRDDVLELKMRLFSEVFRVLSDDGIFIAAVGTPIGFPNSKEIINTATRVGFTSENIILVPTTDPTCYDTVSKKHTFKNFFFIAMKGVI